MSLFPQNVSIGTKFKLLDEYYVYKMTNTKSGLMPQWNKVSKEEFNSLPNIIIETQQKQKTIKEQLLSNKLIIGGLVVGAVILGLFILRRK